MWEGAESALGIERAARQKSFYNPCFLANSLAKLVSSFSENCAAVMSSAVQPSPSTSTQFKHARLLATYPVDMFKALEPFMPALLKCYNRQIDPSNPVAINKQLITIYELLGHARAACQNSLPMNMLTMGGEHIFFNSTQQKHQGDWIKGVFELVRDIENRIRDYFRNPTDPVALLSEVVKNDSPSALSLSRFLAEHRRFNLLTGEIIPAASSSQKTPHHSHDSVRAALRLGMKPITAP